MDADDEGPQRVPRVAPRRSYHGPFFLGGAPSLANARLARGAELVRLPGIGVAGHVVVLEVQEAVAERLVRRDQVARGTVLEVDPGLAVVARVAGLDSGARDARRQQDAIVVVVGGAGRTDGVARRGEDLDPHPRLRHLGALVDRVAAAG